MKKILTLAFVPLISFCSNLADYQKYLQTQQTQFNNYKQNIEVEFDKYAKMINNEFNNYKKELSKYWKNPEITTKTSFVEYSKNKKIRKKVDYKNNYIEIDVIAKNYNQAKKQIANSLSNLLLETTKNAFYKNPVLVKIDKQLNGKKSVPTNEPIVSDMIFKKPPTTQKVKLYTKKVLKKHKIYRVKAKLPNMYVYKLKIKLPPRAFLAKAKLFKSDVFKRANNFKLTPEFIYAIIHTESSFNPMARSYIPAFGLMQIVPKTAGADAYEMLTGHKKILTPSYLYNAHNNILIGSAYLYEIYYRYLRYVKNPLSRLYCTIAAYNTGAGNVACAFNSTKKYRGRTICRRSDGDYNIYKASKKINKLTPSEVYNHLLKNLRYDEAKNYLRRVTKRIYIYKKAISLNEL